jgi:predicted ArsR family transcriptional regulator
MTGPVVSDPIRIRALAHPLRLRLVALLRDEREATATRCAELTGESVASCSFHLRQLAKYGWVETAGRHGREKPWRLVAREVTTAPDPDVPGSLRATAALADLTATEQLRRVRTFLAHADNEPPEWVAATALQSAGFWATAEEATALNRAVEELVGRFREREDDAGLRPPGSRRVRLFAVVNPDPAPPPGRAR